MPAPPIIVSDRRGRLCVLGLASRLRVSPIDKRCAVHWGHESSENAIDNPLNLDIPDHLQYSEEHVWVDDSASTTAIVGITAYAEQQLGELVFIDLPDEGTRVEAGDEVLELECRPRPSNRWSARSPVPSAMSTMTPRTTPPSSTTTRTGEGWLLKIELDDDEPELLDAEVLREDRPVTGTAVGDRQRKPAMADGDEGT